MYINLYRTPISVQLSFKKKVHKFDLNKDRSLCGLIRAGQITMFEKITCKRCINAST